MNIIELNRKKVKQDAYSSSVRFYCAKIQELHRLLETDLNSDPKPEGEIFKKVLHQLNNAKYLLEKEMRKQ